MPTNWQQWYPHNIDAWQSSPMIQDLSDAAYRAYHNLIQAQYQAEDGMLSSEEKELIRFSRMRNSWQDIRAEVLACFHVAENGRLFSPRQYSEWTKAQLVHSKRVKAADKTNKALKRKRAVTVQSPERQPAHIDTNNNKNKNNKEKEQKPSRAKREPDPRHTPFRQALEGYWRYKNASTELPWDGKDAKALATLLAASPDLTLDHFRDLLRHRARSQVAHGDRVYLWVAKIHSFTAPLDRFNKPEMNNGTSGQHHQGAAVGRVKRTGSAWDKSIEQRLAHATGSDAAPDVRSDAAPGVRPGDDGRFPADLRGSGTGIRGETPRDGPPIVPESSELFPPPKRSPKGT